MLCSGGQQCICPASGLSCVKNRENLSWETVEHVHLHRDSGLDDRMESVLAIKEAASLIEGDSLVGQSPFFTANGVRQGGYPLGIEAPVQRTPRKEA